jgi:hypothetical protein
MGRMMTRKSAQVCIIFFAHAHTKEQTKNLAYVFREIWKFSQAEHGNNVSEICCTKCGNNWFLESHFLVGVPQTCFVVL